MNCPYCGSANQDGTRFCVGCGANIEGAAPRPPVQNYQQSYQPPVYQNVPAVNPLTAPMRTSEFFWMYFVLAIPFAGFICALVWAFGSNVNQNRQNLSRAVLIWMLVGVCLSIVFGIIFTLLGISIADSLSSGYYY
ncbi:MAG TPA: zinc ribbon domain-containing protein [Clostridia bacterium]|nr:zinc ribbon domain-containing protein [Clostridia bacterium]